MVSLDDCLAGVSGYQGQTCAVVFMFSFMVLMVIVFRRCRPYAYMSKFTGCQHKDKSRSNG